MVSLPDPGKWVVVSCVLLVLVPVLEFELVFLFASLVLLGVRKFGHTPVCHSARDFSILEHSVRSRTVPNDENQSTKDP